MEEIIWLLVGAAIGFGIGWLLRQRFLGKKLEEQYATSRTDEERLRGELQIELQGFNDTAKQLADDLEARTAELELRTADLDRGNVQIAERDKTVANLEASLKTARKSATKNEGQIADRESTIASLRSQKAKTGSVDVVRRELDAANGTIGALRKDADGYQATIASLRVDLDAARSERADLTERVDLSASEMATVTASLAASRSTSEGFQDRIAELESSSGADSDQMVRVADLDAQLAASLQERDQASAALHAFEELHAGCGVVAGDETDVVEVPVAQSAGTPDKDSAVAKVTEIATRTRGSGPVVEDDLNKIRGVGPKLDKLLKSLDITSFRQVANFTPDDIQYVTAALEAFPGRIERDDWMASAAEEHSNKYGEPV